MTPKRTIECLEERDRLWEELQERISKLSSDLEDALTEQFEGCRYDNSPRPEDSDYPLVKNIWNMIMAMEEAIKMRRQVLDIAVGKYESFCLYWVHGYTDGWYVPDGRVAPKGKKTPANNDGNTRKEVS